MSADQQERERLESEVALAIQSLMHDDDPVFPHFDLPRLRVILAALRSTPPEPVEDGVWEARWKELWKTLNGDGVSWRSDGSAPFLALMVETERRIGSLPPQQEPVAPEYWVQTRDEIGRWEKHDGFDTKADAIERLGMIVRDVAEGRPGMDFRVLEVKTVGYVPALIQSPDTDGRQ